jgi:hypothetical protein
LVIGIGLLAATACGASPGTLSAENKALASYFAELYRLQSDQMAASAELMPTAADFKVLASGETDPTAFQAEYLEKTRAIYSSYVAGLEAVEPPAPAASYHEAQLASIKRSADEQDALLEDMASGDPERMAQAIGDLGRFTQKLLEESHDLSDQGAALVQEALAGQDDPESVYITDLLSLRNSESMRKLESFFGGFNAFAEGSPEALMSQLDTGIALFETMKADYSAITPPQRWAALHNAHIQIFDDSIAFYRDLGSFIANAIDDPESVSLDDVERFTITPLELAKRSAELSATLFREMADYFEAIAA